VARIDGIPGGAVNESAFGNRFAWTGARFNPVERSLCTLPRLSSPKERNYVTAEKSFLTESGTISFDPRYDYMFCSCGNTDPLDGFDSVSDISDLGGFRLAILDWLIRLRIVPVGIVSAVFTCASCCGAVYCVTPRDLRIAKRPLPQAGTRRHQPNC
jgi:hypothetical protein